MNSEILIAVLSLTGTLVGSVSGILISNKLVNFRLEQLERKVEKHNNLIERMVAVESSVKSAHKRIDDLRSELDDKDDKLES